MSGMTELSGKTKDVSVNEPLVGNIVGLSEIVVVSRADEDSGNSANSSESEEIGEVHETHSVES
jgi:hypothetical protein